MIGPHPSLVYRYTAESMDANGDLHRVTVRWIGLANVLVQGICWTRFIGQVRLQFH